jgi:membrane protease YdiL (CAAX protease family)
LWFVAIVAVSILRGHNEPPDASIAFLLPRTPAEMALWMIVSILAGISEEAIYRGYLQKQFAALTGGLPAGILISAATFGAVHVYQGWSRATVIAISAILFGVVAHWRRTVRPGMFAHGLQDAIAPLLLKLLRH